MKSTEAPEKLKESKANDLHTQVLTVREYVLSGATVLALAILIFYVKMVRVDERYGDTAMLLQLLDNIANRGTTAGQVMAATIDISTSGILTMTAQQIAANPLLSSGPAAVNHFAFHFYAILFLVAPFVRLFGSQAVLFALFSLSFSGMLFLAYFGLRKCGVPVIAAVVFCVAIMLHPAWSEGLDWQFYPDRLFLVLGLAFMIASTLVPTRLVLLVFLAILCALIDERASITAGLFLLAYTVLHLRSLGRSRFINLGIGAVLVGYGIVLVKFFLPANFYNAGFLPASLAEVVQRFGEPLFLQHTIILLTINASFLLLALFDWKATLVALLLILPNVVGSIGGAEKVGWATHYHDEYFPAVVWAGMCGLVALRRFGIAWGTKNLPLVGASLAVVFLAFVDPATGGFAWARLQQNFFSTFSSQLALYMSEPGRASQQWGGDINAILPEGKTVTSIEPAMSSIYQGRKLEFYPIDIDHADYAVIQRLPGGEYTGAVSFLGPDEQKRINEVLTRRLRRVGYDLVHPLYVSPNGLVVLKRDRD